MNKIRTKFVCDEVVTTVNGKTVKLCPVTSGSEENNIFFKWTPSGRIEIGTFNPFIEFVPGREYYVDFIEVPVGTE